MYIVQFEIALNDEQAEEPMILNVRIQTLKEQQEWEPSLKKR